MAITVNWATDQVINIPKADMTLVQLTPVEVRRLDTDAFFRTLKDLESSAEGMPWPNTQRNNSPVTLGGITYARVLEIIDPYSITFEDGQYVVELTGSNNNIIQKTNPNQVSIQGNNSAGLIQTEEIQYAAYQDKVTLDQTNSTGRAVAGQEYPAGTVESPVNNLTDALFIAQSRGFDTIGIKGNFVFGASDVVDNVIFEGDSAVRHTMILTADALITNCIFRNLTLTGNLDGGCQASFCIIAGLNYIDGSLLDCFLSTGDIVLSGTQANFLRCASAVAGGGVGAYPTIDMGGTGTRLVIRDYQGGIGLKNHTSGDDAVSIDMSSGRIYLDPTISSGTFTLRGIAALEDNSTGTAVVNDQLLDPIRFGKQVGEMHQNDGLDPNNPVTITPTGRNSTGIDLDYGGDGETETTITRQ